MTKQRWHKEHVENRNEGTFGYSPGTKNGTRVHSHVPPEQRDIRQNHPFTKPPFCPRNLEKAGADSGVCSGASRGKVRENRGNVAGNVFFFFLRSATYALNSRISGTGKGKPAANLGSTVPGTFSQPSVQGVFFEIVSYSLLEFF